MTVSCTVRIAPGRDAPELLAAAGTSSLLKVGASSTGPTLGAPAFDSALGVRAIAPAAYDHVLLADAANSAVFAATTTPLADAARRGQTGALIAYGQTGTGKTYNLFDVLLPTLAAELFAPDPNTSAPVTVRAAALQLHNDVLGDLLAARGGGAGASLKKSGSSSTLSAPGTPDRPGRRGTAVASPGPSTPGRRGTASAASPAMLPRGDEAEASGLRWIDCASPAELRAIFDAAAAHRKTSSTNLNDTSSRSHVVLYLHRRVGGGGDDAGKLCVVDLAGSERLKKSGSVGMAQKEAVCINRSLHALSQVVQALATKAAHVPTRASKLTLLLGPYLRQGTRVSLLVCVSPLLAHFSETSNSLAFAQRAMRAELIATPPPRRATLASPTRASLARLAASPGAAPSPRPAVAELPPELAKWHRWLKEQADESAALQASTVQLLREVLAQLERGAGIADAATPPPPPARSRHGTPKSASALTDGGGRLITLPPSVGGGAAPPSPMKPRSALDDVLDLAVDVAPELAAALADAIGCSTSAAPTEARGAALERARQICDQMQQTRAEQLALDEKRAEVVGRQQLLVSSLRHLLALPAASSEQPATPPSASRGLARRDDAAAVATPSPPKSRQHKEMREWRQKSRSLKSGGAETPPTPASPPQPPPRQSPLSTPVSAGTPEERPSIDSQLRKMEARNRKRALGPAFANASPAHAARPSWAVGMRRSPRARLRGLIGAALVVAGVAAIVRAVGEAERDPEAVVHRRGPRPAAPLQESGGAPYVKGYLFSRALATHGTRRPREQAGKWWGPPDT